MSIFMYSNSSPSQIFGLGMEAEAFIMDQTGRQPISRFNGKPAAAVVIDLVKDKKPKLAPHIERELASVFVEVRSGVHQTSLAAAREVQEIRGEINNLLTDLGAQLIFTPVSSLPFEFVASTLEPGSRPKELIELWGKSEEGKENLRASSICSLQINDSRPFRNARTDADRLEIARRVHNICRVAVPANKSRLITNKKDYAGFTRIENAVALLERVKADQFAKRGLAKNVITIPPHFETVTQMQAWMCSHSDKDDFAKTNAKNEHAITCKIKRANGIWIVEVRYADAVESLEEMVQVATVVESILEPIYAN